MESQICDIPSHYGTFGVVINPFRENMVTARCDATFKDCLKNKVSKLVNNQSCDIDKKDADILFLTKKEKHSNVFSAYEALDNDLIKAHIVVPVSYVGGVGKTVLKWSDLKTPDGEQIKEVYIHQLWQEKDAWNVECDYSVFCGDTPERSIVHSIKLDPKKHGNNLFVLVTNVGSLVWYVFEDHSYNSTLKPVAIGIPVLHKDNKQYENT